MDDVDQIASAVREQTITRSLKTASPMARLGAALADFLAVVFLTMATVGVAALASALVGWRERDALFIAVPWATAVFYTAVEILADNSFGKGIAGIVIARPDGSNASRTRLTCRWLVKYSFLILLGMELAIVIMLDLSAKNSRTSKLAAASPSPLLELVVLIASWAWSIALLVIVLGSIGIFFPKGRTLHDWVTGTAVFNHLDRARKPGPMKRAFSMEQPELPIPDARFAPADEMPEQTGDGPSQDSDPAS